MIKTAIKIVPSLAFFSSGIRPVNLSDAGPSGGLNAWQTAPAAGFASSALVQVEADGNAVARISAVVQIISVVVVVQVNVIAVVPIV
jgi:hypothetical protein